jgi:hypothetical protein
MLPAMPVIATVYCRPRPISIALSRLKLNSFSLSLYGDPAADLDDLLPSIREHGILVALVVIPEGRLGTWEVISGHRRLACARALGLTKVPCEVRHLPLGKCRQHAILEYNRQRRKNFSQLMREADALEHLQKAEANVRRLANLRRGRIKRVEASDDADRRNSDGQANGRDPSRDVSRSFCTTEANFGRTDSTIAAQLGMGGKDVYRQARAIWRLARTGDVRAQSGVAQLDAGVKRIHAAYKDLRRRDRFSVDFLPTPYDVWSFRQDRAFGIPHPGAIPPALIAHALHYYTAPNALVVDPMAGGGTTLDVCQSMGRRCLAYDLHPTRPDVRPHDVRHGMPAEAIGCDLIFCDPPYHTMLAGQYPRDGIATAPFCEWVAFLHQLTRDAFATLKPGGCIALLLAAQTEKDLPAGYGYLDHAFLGYVAAHRAGFLPERRISCPMAGAYLPQHVRRARSEGRLLGQVRDLLVMRKTSHNRENFFGDVLSMED